MLEVIVCDREALLIPTHCQSGKSMVWWSCVNSMINVCDSPVQIYIMNTRHTDTLAS